MTALREAAQQALEALEEYQSKGAPFLACDGAVDALRAALAQQDEPVQEPVAWLTPKTVDSYMRPDLGYETCSKTDYAAFPVYTAPLKAEPVQEPAFHGFMSADGTQVDLCFSPSAPRRDGTYATAYYTAPPQQVAQQAEPLNLRDPAVQKRLATQWGYVPAAQAEPVEPVAWECKAGGLKPLTQRQYDAQTAAIKRHYTRTAPPQRTIVPLTAEEIMHIGMTHQSLRQVARAVERAHGIKE